MSNAASVKLAASLRRPWRAEARLEGRRCRPGHRNSKGSFGSTAKRQARRQLSRSSGETPPPRLAFSASKGGEDCRGVPTVQERESVESLAIFAFSSSIALVERLVALGGGRGFSSSSSPPPGHQHGRHPRFAPESFCRRGSGTWPRSTAGGAVGQLDGLLHQPAEAPLPHHVARVKSLMAAAVQLAGP